MGLSTRRGAGGVKPWGRWGGPSRHTSTLQGVPGGGNCLAQNLKSLRDSPVCGQAREAGDAVDGTGFAGVRGHARSHRGSALAWSGRRTCSSSCLSQILKSLRDSPVGAGKPAKQATRYLAPAAPVFAGMPAPSMGAALAGSCRRTCRSNCLSQILKSLRDSLWERALGTCGIQLVIRRSHSRL